MIVPDNVSIVYPEDIDYNINLSSPIVALIKEIL
jgi:hypothetical protein